MNQPHQNMNQPIHPGAGAPQQGGQRPQMHVPASRIGPAGLGVRFVAAFIDGIIVGIIQNVILIPLQLLLVGSEPNPSAAFMLIGVSYGVMFAVMGGYYGYFYTTKGASPGKLIFKIRVVNKDNGTKLTWGQAILRETIGKFISAIIMMIGYIMAAFRDDKRALHDLIANSVVVQQHNK